MKLAVGFTGTREGMTESQKIVVRRILQKNASRFHHGDCIGADAEAHEIAAELGIYTVSHPPIIDKKRAFCGANGVLPAKAYLDRNKDIVEITSLLVAAPSGKKEQGRSRTWSTIRWAKKRGKALKVVFPDGSCEAY